MSPSLERKEETEVWIGGAFVMVEEVEDVDEVRSCDARSTEPLASRRSSNAADRVRSGWRERRRAREVSVSGSKVAGVWSMREAAIAAEREGSDEAGGHRGVKKLESDDLGAGAVFRRFEAGGIARIMSR